MSERNADDGYLWGARAIGREIDRSTRQVHYLVEGGYLKCVKKVGGLYVAERGALRRELSAVVQHEESAA
jgi:hypothetical protein